MSENRHVRLGMFYSPPPQAPLMAENSHTPPETFPLGLSREDFQALVDSVDPVPTAQALTEASDPLSEQRKIAQTVVSSPALEEVVRVVEESFDGIRTIESITEEQFDLLTDAFAFGASTTSSGYSRRRQTLPTPQPVEPTEGLGDESDSRHLSRYTDAARMQLSLKKSLLEAAIRVSVEDPHMRGPIYSLLTSCIVVAHYQAPDPVHFGTHYALCVMVARGIACRLSDSE